MDTTTGSILFSSTVGKATADSDDYVDNPNPSAGVRGDPLILKSDTEMINQVAEPVVVELTDHIASSLETYGNKYFELGNEAARNDHNEEAVEQYVNFLYCCPKCAPSDRKEAMVFIKKTRNYDCDDIEAMDCRGYWGLHGKNLRIPTKFARGNVRKHAGKEANRINAVQSSEVPIGWISPPLPQVPIQRGWVRSLSGRTLFVGARHAVPTTVCGFFTQVLIPSPPANACGRSGNRFKNRLDSGFRGCVAIGRIASKRPFAVGQASSLSKCVPHALRVQASFRILLRSSGMTFPRLRHSLFRRNDGEKETISKNTPVNRIQGM